MLHRYKFTLNSDSGKYHLLVNSSSINAAINQVLSAENCPERSILSIKVVKFDLVK